MTLKEFTTIVRLLANSYYVRYWQHYNYPALPPLMAISILGLQQRTSLDLLNKEFDEKGFKPVEGSLIWTIERTDLDWLGFEFKEDDRTND
ncbi:MAG: hypothetical protein KME45_02865 [Stenomitos rutilans HA7619-LM2]|jgi:hypothetical protein|nr:hypothetical protein [Stenomitos rutilans HA7619-LM2]MBW4469325.1 hypothetical protein [Stenomitos rutilans HA7619-LM2]